MSDSAIRMYATRFCPYCIRARQLLQAKGVGFTEIAVDGNPALRAEMEASSGRHTVPQIWIGSRHVGGFDDLWRLEQRGELDVLLGATG
jgi:glutaredoxin 3